ncbi:DNA primase [Steroidobacter denitrificans]|uniref:DNA primase n=1 Tax=Steroidobacter denitrificans TaxID=465721 RepID=A0A127F800_STEDE|nr:DNA primase [Steroidobacter denitrificans]AMN45725.1 DNA primase [Steroidobacter denitrificans]
MSGRIPQHFIDELIARADIVELIGMRVPLKKHGKEFKACCPFHGEKTPSFTVVPEKQFYHCFGCGAHGTALGFLMEHDHLSFVEAVEDLAERVGLEVPRENRAIARPTTSDGLFAILEEAARLYRRELENSERARNYFRARGLDGEIAANFGLGHAPDAWDFLTRTLGRSDSDRQQLLRAGLIVERERKPSPREGSAGYYDRFRDRVMFPIRDARGRTIGFGGRVLDKGEPKYLNSPETELFHKGRELYGLYEARQASRILPRLLIVEGYMDVIRLHQAGIAYAVATLGTATTPDHLTRVFRLCNELVFCFDGDRAGRAAAWKALENSLSQMREGRQIRFLFLPDGQDPDSLVGAEGREAFEERLGGAVPLSEYFINHLSAQVDLQSLDGRARLGELARPLLERIPVGLYRELLADAVARTVGLDRARLNVALHRQDGVAAGTDTSASPHPRTHLGRHSLVRQAIRLLVHYPQIANCIPDTATLARLERPGAALLVELIETLKAQPCATTGTLLERWRNRPDIRALAKLATQEPLIRDMDGAASELRGAIQQLAEESNLMREIQLLRKRTGPGLDETEQAELQALLVRPRGHPPALHRR